METTGVISEFDLLRKEYEELDKRLTKSAQFLAKQTVINESKIIRLETTVRRLSITVGFLAGTVIAFALVMIIHLM